MKNKKIYSLLLVVVLAIISIYLFAILDVGLQKSAKTVQMREYNIYRTLEALVLIIFGILIEYKKLLFIFKKGVHINKYTLIASLVLIIILIIPYDITVYLGLGYPSSIKGLFHIL